MIRIYETVVDPRTERYTCRWFLSEPEGQWLYSSCSHERNIILWNGEQSSRVYTHFKIDVSLNVEVEVDPTYEY